MRQFRSMRFEGLVQSDIRRMTRECEKLDGINLAQGNSDMPTPPIVLEAAIKAIRAQKNTYTLPEGVAELRNAIAEKLRNHNGIEADPNSEIVLTVGATGGFATTLMALLNPGDGILMFEPYYGYHLNSALATGLEPQFLTLNPPDFMLREDNLRAAIQPNTKAVVICTPSNPSGKMFSHDELITLARIAKERDLLVITDEVYEYIRYDGRLHISPATVGDLWERTVSILSLSKTFSITGWRLGYVVAPEAMARLITLANDLYYVCAPTPLQHGVIAGIRAPEEFYESLQAEYAKKRDMICDALNEARMDPIVPQGAYYVLANIEHLGYETALDTARAILGDVGVAAVPGTAFYRGANGEKLLRFCFAKESRVLEQACRKITQFHRRKPLSK